MSSAPCARKFIVQACSSLQYNQRRTFQCGLRAYDTGTFQQLEMDCSQFRRALSLRLQLRSADASVEQLATV
jgi:hypothetical protein